MKKTKKILAGILTAAILMSPATAWAGPSITDKVVVVEDSVGKYIVTDKVEESEVFKTIEAEDKEMVDLIKEVNEGKKDIEVFTDKLKVQLETIIDEKAKEIVEKVLKEVEEKKLEFLTGFMSLEKEKDAEIEKNESGKYDVTIHVPILVKDLKDIVILYYNKELKCWEFIEPTEFDFENQTIKFEVEDFSLISVLANTEDVKTAEVSE